MGDHRDPDQPQRADELEVKELVRALRALEEELVGVLSSLKPPARIGIRGRAVDNLTGDSSGDDTSDSSDSSASDLPFRFVTTDYPASTGPRSQESPQCAPCRTQLIVNGTLALPPEKPDIEAILRFTPVCRVTNWQCVHTADGRKIVVTGVVEIGVEYVANMPDQPMHFAHFVVPFHTFFLCPKPIRDVLCDVEFKHHETLDPRTISKVVLLNVRGVT